MKTFSRWTFMFAALALQGCATTDQTQDLAKSASAAATVSESASTRTLIDAQSLNVYKQQAAQLIYDSSRQSFVGQLPPLLKSVVVLDITLDTRGHPIKVAVRRSNGFKALERIAMDSVKHTAVFPPPSAAVLKGNKHLHYLETWLFRDDGKFQIRSLAESQAGAEAIVIAKNH